MSSYAEPMRGPMAAAFGFINSVVAGVTAGGVCVWWEAKRQCAALDWLDHVLAVAGGWVWMHNNRLHAWHERCMKPILGVSYQMLAQPTP